MNVSPMKVLKARALWSVDGIIFAVELLSATGIFAATVLLVILLYHRPAEGALWLALPISLTLLVGSGYKARLDWKRIGDTGKYGESEAQTDGTPAS